MKTCPSCGETKALDCFSKQSDKRDGRRANCKTCVSARESQFRTVHSEKVRTRHAKYRGSHAEKIKAYNDARNFKCRELLTDTYVRKTLQLFASEATPELIAAKREQLQIHRLTQQLKKEIRNA